MPYQILKPVDANEVPDWQRNPPKWADLVNEVFKLKPGQSLPVRFDDPKVAKRARDAVRDMANLKARAVILRTRVVKNHDGSATLYLTRVFPMESSAE